MIQAQGPEVSVTEIARDKETGHDPSPQHQQPPILKMHYRKHENSNRERYHPTLRGKEGHKISHPQRLNQKLLKDSPQGIEQEQHKNVLLPELTTIHLTIPGHQTHPQRKDHGRPKKRRPKILCLKTPLHPQS